MEKGRWGEETDDGLSGEGDGEEEDGERPCASLTARRSSGFDCNVPFSRRRLPTGAMNSCPASPSSQNSRVSALSIAPIYLLVSIVACIPPSSTHPLRRTPRCTAVHVPAPAFPTPQPPLPDMASPTPRPPSPLLPPLSLSRTAFTP